MKHRYDNGIPVTRPRGKDKAKDRYERNGGYSTRHLRLITQETKVRSNAK